MERSDTPVANILNPNVPSFGPSTTVPLCFLAGEHPILCYPVEVHGLHWVQEPTIESIHIDGLEGYSALGQNPTMLGTSAPAGECFPEVPRCVNGSTTMVNVLSQNILVTFWRFADV